MNKDELREAKTKCHEEAMTRFRMADEDLTPVIQAARFGWQQGYAAGKPKWIPVSERLPDGNGLVVCVVTLQLGGRLIATFDSYYKTWTDSLGNQVKPKAWMSLPEPYTEGEQ
jgi:hypothetical protein